MPVPSVMTWQIEAARSPVLENRCQASQNRGRRAEVNYWHWIYERVRRQLWWRAVAYGIAGMLTAVLALVAERIFPWEIPFNLTPAVVDSLISLRLYGFESAAGQGSASSAVRVGMCTGRGGLLTDAGVSVLPSEGTLTLGGMSPAMRLRPARRKGCSR